MTILAQATISDAAVQQWQNKLLLAATTEDETEQGGHFAPAPANHAAAPAEQAAMEGGAQTLSAGVLAALAMLQVIIPTPRIALEDTEDEPASQDPEEDQPDPEQDQEGSPDQS